MTTKLEQVLRDTKGLSANDRAFIAHCLISSLEVQHDEGVDAAWSSLAEQRIDELSSGEVHTMTWDEIKGQLKRSS